MARNTQEFETIVKLNAQQAENQLAKLKQTVTDLKQKKDDMLASKNYDAKDLRTLNKEIRQANSAMNAYESNVKKVIDIVSDLDHASLGEIQRAASALRKQMKGITDEKEYAQLDRLLQKCNSRIIELKGSTGKTADEMKKTVEETQNLANVLRNVNGASMSSLKQAATTVQSRMDKMAPDSTGYAIQARNLAIIKARIQEINEEQKKVNLTIDKYDEEIKLATSAAADLTRENQLIEHTLNNISGANIRDLEYSLKLVNEQLRNVGHDSDEFDKLAQKAQQLKQEINNVNDELQAPEEKKNIFSSVVDGLDKHWGAITQLWAGLTGLTSTIKQCSDAYAKMEDVMANTTKYTGQTDAQVREMNEDFMEMDTRTPREQLNELAGAAGRLGITSKQGIEEFVDAADKISVALGDDLGDGAVDQIGKLAMAFGEDDRKGLRGAMLATGSAVNELAQSCSANAGYLVDFTARVAGVGKQFGLSQTQIMGFGAVMDENMQKDEMASTAFSQLLTKMTTDTKTFAKMAGIPFEEFQEKLKKDANGAVIDFLESLNKKGNFQTLAKMFQDMNLDGTRATAVLTTMADKIDDIKTRQETAATAYEKATSVIEEFDTQNNTVQADVDKAKKQFQELTIVLGQRLMPIAKAGISTASILVKSLNKITGFAVEYWKVLLPLTAALSVYIIKLNLENIILVKNWLVKQKDLILGKLRAAAIAVETAATTAYGIAVDLVTGKVTLATAAQEMWNKVIKANPWGVAATILATFTTAIIAYASSADEATESQKKLNEANNEAAVSCRSEIQEISTLVEIAQDQSKSTDMRRDAIKKLQEKYPDYLSNLSLENVNSKAASESIDNLTASIMAQAQARVYLAKVEEIEREKQDVNEDYLDSFMGKIKHTLAAGFESLANSAADFGERMYNGFNKFLNGGNNPFKDFSRGFKEETFITRNGYGRNLQEQYFINWKVDLSNLQKEQDMYVRQYRQKQQQIAKINADAIANQKKLNDYNNQNKNDDTNSDYKTEAEKKEEAREQAKKAREQKAAERAAANAAKKQEAEKAKAEALAKKEQAKAIKAQKTLTDVEIVENYRKYSEGLIDLRKYREEEKRIQLEGLDEQIKIYGKETNEAKECANKKAEIEKKYNEEVLKMDENDIKQKYAKQSIALQMQFNDRNSKIYNNQEALNEALYENEIDELQERQGLYEKGTEEWLNIQAEIEQKEGEHRLQNAQHYEELLSQYREQYGKKDLEKEKELSLNGIEWMKNKELSGLKEVDKLNLKEVIEHNEKVNEITRRYAEMRLNILRYYALQQSQQKLETSKGETFKKESHNLYETASNNAKADYQDAHPEGENAGDYLTSDVTIYASTLDKIKQMEQEGLYSHQQAMAAMGEATAQMCSGMAAKMQAAYDAISPIMDAMSSYYSAQCDLEVTKTEKKYEKLIDKAGNNQAKQKKLQEKQEKEIAKIKTKYNRKQVKMQIAQAIAQTAMSAISAYSSVMAGAPWPANQILAPIAAGIALAAGAIQIASIKKQAQAQEAGYYEGGFTGGSSYRREAGVVHQGEFVANHVAVNNPQLLPAFRLIDQAQRNNTVGSLTASEVSQSMGVGGATVVSAPSVVVNQDNSDIAGTLLQARDTLERLGALLEDGVSAVVTIDGPNGLDKQYRRFKKLKDNV